MRMLSGGIAACALVLLAAPAQAGKKDPPPPLHAAVSAGDLEEVSQMLEDGADIDELDSNGENALMHACWEGHTEMAQLLVDNGINKNSQDRGGDYPLLFAAFRGELAIVQLLCDSGGLEPNLQNMGGYTALMMAIQTSREAKDGMKMVATLLSCGASTTITQKEGRDAYSLAREDAREEVQELIKAEDRCSMLCNVLCSEGDNKPSACRGWDDGTSAITGTVTKCELNDDGSACAVEGGDCIFIEEQFASPPDAACVDACTAKHAGSHGCKSGNEEKPRRRKRSAVPGDKPDL